MKKILSLVLATTFLSSSPILAMNVGVYEKDLNLSRTSSSHGAVDKKKEPLLKYREHIESEQDFYEDRCTYLKETKKEYEESLKTKGKIDTLNTISKKLGLQEDHSTSSIESFLSQAIRNAEAKVELFTTDLNDLDKILNKNDKSIDKLKTVFSFLLKRHTEILNVRLTTFLQKKRERELRKISESKEIEPYKYSEGDKYLLLHIKKYGPISYLPPSSQDYLKVEASEINKEYSRTATESHQYRLYFLKKLYKFVKSHLTNEQRVSIQLNKNLYDVLEEKIKDLGHPDQALETLPTPKAIDDASYWIADKKNKNKLILTYYKRPFRLEEGNSVFDKDDEREPMISWDLVTLKNIDDVPSQVKYFFPNLNEESKNSIFEHLKEKRKQLENQRKKKIETLKYEITKVDEPKTHPIVSVELQKARLILRGAKRHVPETKAPQVRPIVSVKPKVHKFVGNKNNVSLGKDSIKNNNNNSSSISGSLLSKDRLSQDTCDALSKLFKFTPAKIMHWDDFVGTWKELRKVVDGVQDEPTNVGNVTHKFRGGTLLQGSKNKARSFNIHKPHAIDGLTLGPKSIARIGGHFQDKFGWTLEKLKEYGFEKEK